MPRRSNARNAELPAHDLKISFRIANRNPRARLRGKNQRMRVIGHVPVQHLAQLNAYWYESLFVAFSLNAKNEVVEVHILARAAPQLAYLQSSVQSNEHDGVSARLIPPGGLELDNPFDGFFCPFDGFF